MKLSKIVLKNIVFAVILLGTISTMFWWYSHANSRRIKERNMQRTEAAHGRQVIGSNRGASSHQYNPMI